MAPNRHELYGSLAMSDIGPRTISGATRGWMALHSLVVHNDRTLPQRIRRTPSRYSATSKANGPG